jgi:hypothetical protein
MMMMMMMRNQFESVPWLQVIIPAWHSTISSSLLFVHIYILERAFLYQFSFWASILMERCQVSQIALLLIVFAIYSYSHSWNKSLSLPEKIPATDSYSNSKPNSWYEEYHIMPSLECDIDICIILCYNEPDYDYISWLEVFTLPTANIPL